MPDYQCPYCSSAITADARFCPACGERLTMTSAPSPTPSVPVRSDATSSPPPSQGRRAGPPAVLIAAALVLVAGLGAFGLVQTGVFGARPTIPPPGATVSPPTSAPGLSDACIREVGPFVSALQDLDSRLSVGLSFNDYSTRVGDVRVAYDRIKPAGLDALCLNLVASPGEDAFNHYVNAYNTWNDCIGNVDCANDSITPELQDEWAKATVLIDKIRASLP